MFYKYIYLILLNNLGAITDITDRGIKGVHIGFGGIL